MFSFVAGGRFYYATILLPLTELEYKVWFNMVAYYPQLNRMNQTDENGNILGTRQPQIEGTINQMIQSAFSSSVTMFRNTSSIASCSGTVHVLRVTRMR